MEMDIEENTIGYETREGREGEMDPAVTPAILYSLGFDAEELLTVYAGLRTYLKALAGRETEDLEQIARATKLLMALRPRAIKASREVSLKATGMEGKNVGTD
jgi:hypothetical protein